MKKHMGLIGLAAGFLTFLSGLGSMFGVDVAAMVGGAGISAFSYFFDFEEKAFDFGGLTGGEPSQSKQGP